MYDTLDRMEETISEYEFTELDNPLMPRAHEANHRCAICGDWFDCYNEACAAITDANYDGPFTCDKPACEDASKDSRIWQFKVTQADDPEGNSEDYYLLRDLERIAGEQLGDIYKFAQSMQPGDSFTYTSEQALCTFRVKCSDGREQ